MLSCSTVIVSTHISAKRRAGSRLCAKISPQLAKTGVNLLDACSQIVELGSPPPVHLVEAGADDHQQSRAGEANKKLGVCCHGEAGSLTE